MPGSGVRVSPQLFAWTPSANLAGPAPRRVSRVPMKTFDLYRHPTLGYEAVKRGFSWPGFFITPLWALSKRMWLGGALLLVIWFFLFAARADARAQGAA